MDFLHFGIQDMPDSYLDVLWAVFSHKKLFAAIYTPKVRERERYNM